MNTVKTSTIPHPGNSPVQARGEQAHGEAVMSPKCRHEVGAAVRRASHEWAQLKQMAA